MKNQIQHSIDGAATAGLSIAQKRTVAIQARKAWIHQGRPEYADQDPDADPGLRITATEAYNLWRQNQQRAACGKLHLTFADQRDYLVILAHFQRLAGDDRAADRHATMAATDDTRRALGKLKRELDKAADVIECPADYIAAIAGSKYRTRKIEDLSPKQIWSLVYDIRRAAAARRKRLPF